jgi:hypothetical protein
MAAHRWALSRDKPSTDRTRFFVCERCGAGPVSKDILSGKGSINKAAKAQGVDPNCFVEVARRVMDS